MLPLSACPVCQNDILTPWFQFDDDHGRWSLDRCPRCGHGCVNPQPDWSELAPYYTTEYAPYSRKSDTESREYKRNIENAARLGEYRHTPFNAGDRLLDFGCGAGDFISVMGQLGVDAYGVDPSLHAVEAAQHRGLQAYQGTSQDLRSIFPNMRFSTITANHVIEHVHDPVDVIRHLGEALTADGRIVIAVPNSRCWACRVLKKAWHSTDVPRHIQQFTIQSMCIAAERAGLAVERLWTYSLPKAATGSCQIFLRHFAMVPRRLTELLPGFAAFTGGPFAKALDRWRAGEAVLVWLRHPG